MSLQFTCAGGGEWIQPDLGQKEGEKTCGLELFFSNHRPGRLRVSENRKVVGSGTSSGSNHQSVVYDYAILPDPVFEKRHFRNSHEADRITPMRGKRTPRTRLESAAGGARPELVDAAKEHTKPSSHLRRQRQVGHVTLIGALEEPQHQDPTDAHEHRDEVEVAHARDRSIPGPFHREPNQGTEGATSNSAIPTCLHSPRDERTSDGKYRPIIIR